VPKSSHRISHWGEVSGETRRGDTRNRKSRHQALLRLTCRRFPSRAGRREAARLRDMPRCGVVACHEHLASSASSRVAPSRALPAGHRARPGGATTLATTFRAPAPSTPALAGARRVPCPALQAGTVNDRGAILLTAAMQRWGANSNSSIIASLTDSSGTGDAAADLGAAAVGASLGARAPRCGSLGGMSWPRACHSCRNRLPSASVCRFRRVQISARALPSCFLALRYATGDCAGTLATTSPGVLCRCCIRDIRRRWLAAMSAPARCAGALIVCTMSATLSR